VRLWWVFGTLIVFVRLDLGRRRGLGLFTRGSGSVGLPGAALACTPTKKGYHQKSSSIINL
jgi:hypothetical protein